MTAQLTHDPKPHQPSGIAPVSGAAFVTAGGARRERDSALAWRASGKEGGA